MGKVERIDLSDSVLLAMQMAQEAAEVQCGRKLVWRRVNIVAEEIQEIRKGLDERTVKLSGVLRWIDELGEFHPRRIECDLVQDIHWTPKEVRIIVPSGTTRYICEQVENTNKWAPDGWVIKKATE